MIVKKVPGKEWWLYADVDEEFEILRWLSVIKRKAHRLEQRRESGELDFDKIEIGIYPGTECEVRVWPVWRS